MKRHIPVLIAVSLLCVWAALPTPAQDEDQIVGASVAELLTQKKQVLQERLDYLRALHETGSVAFDRVTEAEEAVLSTELEMATNKGQRLEILARKIKSRQFLERLSAERFNDSGVPLDVKLSAKANRIQAEIDYAREAARPDGEAP